MLVSKCVGSETEAESGEAENVVKPCTIGCTSRCKISTSRIQPRKLGNAFISDGNYDSKASHV